MDQNQSIVFIFISETQCLDEILNYIISNSCLIQSLNLWCLSFVLQCSVQKDWSVKHSGLEIMNIQPLVKWAERCHGYLTTSVCNVRNFIGHKICFVQQGHG